MDRTGEPAPLSMVEFARRVSTLYRTGGRRPATARRMELILRELQEAGARTTADLTTELIARWEAQHAATRNANTVIGLLTVVRAATSYAVEEGWLARPPAYRRVRPRPAAPRPKTWMAWKELVQLLDHLADRARSGGFIAGRLHALVATMAYTGMRRNEALFLRCQDVELGARVIRLTSILERPLKTASSARVIPVCPELAAILEAWISRNDGPWLFPGSRQRRAWHGGGPGRRPIDALKQAAAEAGIPDPQSVTWQSLRHSWATHAETRWGFSGPAIDRVLGHACPGVTGRYTHADESNLTELGPRISFASASAQRNGGGERIHPPPFVNADP